MNVQGFQCQPWQSVPIHGTCRAPRVGHSCGSPRNSELHLGKAGYGKDWKGPSQAMQAQLIYAHKISQIICCSHCFWLVVADGNRILISLMYIFWYPLISYYGLWLSRFSRSAFSKTLQNSWYSPTKWSSPPRSILKWSMGYIVMAWSS